MHGQQRLVGRHHVLARADGGHRPVARGAGAARHFHQHVHLGCVATCIGSLVRARPGPPRPRHGRGCGRRPPPPRCRARAARDRPGCAPARCVPAPTVPMPIMPTRRGAGPRVLRGRRDWTGSRYMGFSGTNEQKKTQLPELGFVHSSWGEESDHQVAAGMATCACSGGRGGNGGNHSCPIARVQAGSIMQPMGGQRMWSGAGGTT